MFKGPDGIIGKLVKNHSNYLFATKYNREINFLCSTNKTNNKLVLLSYILAPFKYRSQNACKAVHANYAAAWEIVNILNDLGYNVDVVEASNKQYQITKKYDVLIGTLDCIERFSPFLSKKCTKIFYALGVYVDERNGPNGELGRVTALEERTGCHYVPKRLFSDPELIKRSVEKSDAVIITGGKATIESFPSAILEKSIHCTMPIYPETIPKIQITNKKSATDYLWFFGFGQVHKGLDLVIEAFQQNPQFKLNIIGEMEDDFKKIYGETIKASNNITFHGFLDTKSKRFQNIIAQCFCFIAPSVNEGISCACATLLQLGLYPIITKETGIDLPKGLGHTLSDSSLESITKALHQVDSLSKHLLAEEIEQLKQFSIAKYSPYEFNRQFRQAIQTITHSA